MYQKENLSHFNKLEADTIEKCKYPTQRKFIFSTPIIALEKKEKRHLPNIETTEKTLQQDATDRKNVFCRNCGQAISSTKFIININGSSEHSFFNPSGIVYQIICFSYTESVINRGIPTKDFSWFQGFRWQYCLCSACQVHLGWHYLGEDRHFWGLIQDRLILGDD